MKMVAQRVELAGKRFVILEESEFERLSERAAVTADAKLPDFPERLASGNYPAIEALRVGLARKLIARRWNAGLTQRECARRAGVRVELLSQIEQAKITADTKTITKIDRVLEKAERSNRAVP